MSSKTLIAAGATGALGARALLVRVIAAKLRRDLDRLNAGDPGPLLKGYADDAVLVFNDGDHRWAGEHRGKEAIARFLDTFMAAGLTGVIKDVLVTGPPWNMRIAIRFDDWAKGPEGEELYANRIVLYVTSRWGRIVRHEDFYEDTKRIEDLEQKLRALEPVAA